MPNRASRAPSIFISANELSGDHHAAALARAFQAYRQQRGLPPAHLAGNGSTRLREAGVDILHDVTHMGALGIVHIILKTPISLRVLWRTRRHIMRTRPDMVVLVDSRVFHLRLAAMLRRSGYRGKIVYFVAPVRWESLYNPAEHMRSLSNPRFLQLKKYCDLALLIYPVSLRTYEELDIPHAFIGHPSCELARAGLSPAQFARLVGLRPGDKRIVIGAMPGSRVSEVHWIAGTMYRALALMAEALADDPALPRLHVVTPVAHPDLRAAVLRAAERAGLHDLTLIDGDSAFELMRYAQLMVVKSGTSLHEVVLADCPAVMCYRVPKYLAWFLRRVMRFGMPFYGLPNLLAGHEVVPELIQENCNELRLAEVAGELLFDQQRREKMREEYAGLRTRLCPNHGDGSTPMERGARELQGLLGNR